MEAVQNLPMLMKPRGYCSKLWKSNVSLKPQGSVTWKGATRLTDQPCSASLGQLESGLTLSQFSLAKKRFGRIGRAKTENKL